MFNLYTFSLFTSQIVSDWSIDVGPVPNLKYIFSFGKPASCKTSFNLS
jgi:hypothetical protein